MYEKYGRIQIMKIGQVGIGQTLLKVPLTYWKSLFAHSREKVMYVVEVLKISGSY